MNEISQRFPLSAVLSKRHFNPRVWDEGDCPMPPTGTIAITDFGWYEYLSQRPYWDEVNFWTPSAHFAFRAEEYSPFLFKLKAPHNAIVGFGHFARYAALPEWLAWDCFKEGNGCSSWDVMKRRLWEIRRRFRYDSEGKPPNIGCIIVVGAIFFPREAWIPQPRDWPVRTLRPTRYDLGVGEGLRVWNECLARVAPPYQDIAAAAEPGSPSRPVFGSPTLIYPRLGQGAFRVAVTEAYGRACAATGEHSLPALDAAHIRPVSQEGPHSVRNGLLLRADLHRLFDQGYLTVTPDHRLEVSRRLRLDYDNGRTYYPLHGSAISLPTGQGERPDPGLLEWHNHNIYLG